MCNTMRVYLRKSSYEFASIVLLNFIIWIIYKKIDIKEEIPCNYSMPTTLFYAKKENNFPIFHRLSPPPNKGIFLVETSGRNYLYPKELCALESAAKKNPERPIYYILTNMEMKEYSALNSLLKEYSNINVVGVELSSFFLQTPMEYLWFYNKIQNSKHKVSHLSDILRFLIIATFGGTYLDSDIIVLKEFPTHFNFAGVENVEKPFHVAVGMFHFHRNHTIINRCVNLLAKNFDGEGWGKNGPILMTNTIKQICNAETMEEINKSDCHETKLLSPEESYPIYYKDWNFLFDPSKNDFVKKSLKDSYIAHYWGKYSSSTPFNKNTTLFELAIHNCPIIAQNYL